MGRKILKGIVILASVILTVIPVKAEVVYYIKIPDEIKLYNRDEEKIGEFEDYTEKLNIPQNPRITPEDTALQKIALAEAEGADIDTMAYIMQTVLNRVSSDDFPDTVEGVISQKGQFSTYPERYNKAEPNEKSEKALLRLCEIENMNQLYFENTVPGSWQSTHLQFITKKDGVSFYR